MVAVLTALGNLDPEGPPPPAVIVDQAIPRGVDGLPALCGEGTLPEGPVCLRIPSELEQTSDKPLKKDRSSGDLLPRRPDRPAEPSRYRYPVGSADQAPRLLAGFDARYGGLRDKDAPEGQVRLAARPGETVRLVGLEGQEGSAEIVFAGESSGLVVATLHHVREGQLERSYLLIHGGLGRLERGITRGAKLEPGKPLGFAATNMDGGLVSITLAARKLREGASLGALDPKRLEDPSSTIPIDLRNVLPLVDAGAAAP